jgi:hypothetical protein
MLEEDDNDDDNNGNNPFLPYPPNQDHSPFCPQNKPLGSVLSYIIITQLTTVFKNR